MGNVTYSELVTRYGEKMAYDLLLSLERSARISAGIVYITEEERLQHVLNEMNKQEVA